METKITVRVSVPDGAVDRFSSAVDQVRAQNVEGGRVDTKGLLTSAIYELLGQVEVHTKGQSYKLEAQQPAAPAEAGAVPGRSPMVTGSAPGPVEPAASSSEPAAAPAQASAESQSSEASAQVADGAEVQAEGESAEVVSGRKAVTSIGLPEALATKLFEANYKTVASVRHATDEDLQKLGGIGKANLDKIRTATKG